MRLATFLSHPIQYYSPWFQHIAKNTNIKNKVFYLWDYGITKTYDRDFKELISWNLPMLDGYDSEILRNLSKNPGTYHFYGLQNPDLIDKIASYAPQAILTFGYLSLSHIKVFLSKRIKKIPIIIKGDSHRLFHKNNFSYSIKEMMIKQILKNSVRLYLLAKQIRIIL